MNKHKKILTKSQESFSLILLLPKIILLITFIFLLIINSTEVNAFLIEESDNYKQTFYDISEHSQIILSSDISNNINKTYLFNDFSNLNIKKTKTNNQLFDYLFLFF